MKTVVFSECPPVFTSLLGRMGGSLFLNLLRNSPSCYFLSAFEFALPPVPFIGVGWKDVEFTQYILRGHSPCTCSFLLLKISHKGIECEEESSQLFPLITISSVSGIFLHYWLCHMISCRSPAPPRIFPRLGACHPPASCLMTKNQSVFLFGVGIYSWEKNAPLDLVRENSPMKLASLKNSCIRRKQRIPQIQLAMPQRKSKVENNLSLQCRCVGKTFHTIFMYLLVLNAKKKEERKEIKKQCLYWRMWSEKRCFFFFF